MQNDKIEKAPQETDRNALVPDAQNLMVLAKQFMDSGLFVQMKNVAGIVTVVEYGRELGLPPVVALQTMAIVSGKICLEAKVMLALFLKSGGKIDIIKKDKTGSTVKLSKEGRADLVESFSIEDAKNLGFLSKQNWRNYPEEMCYWRCTSKGIRAFDPMVTMGIYSIEEAEDFGAAPQGAMPTIKAEAYVKPKAEAEPKVVQAEIVPPEPPQAQETASQAVPEAEDPGPEAPIEPPITTPKPAKPAPAKKPAPAAAAPAPAKPAPKPAPVGLAPSALKERIITLMAILEKDFGKDPAAMYQALMGRIQAIFKRTPENFPDDLTALEAAKTIEILERTVRSEEEKRAAAPAAEETI